MRLLVIRRAVVLAVASFLLSVLFARGSAQESPTVSAGSSSTTIGADSGSGRAEDLADRIEAVQQRKRQSAVAGLLMLCLLCGVFLSFILAVVFWARRIRQQTLEPLPEQNPGDPLWYLRKPGPEVMEKADLDEA